MTRRAISARPFVMEQFKDLQAKYRHFELADIRKFQEVWPDCLLIVYPRVPPLTVCS